MFVNNVCMMSTGRASMSPVLDTFITLLSLGSDGFGKLRTERKVGWKRACFRWSRDVWGLLFSRRHLSA